MNRLKNPTTVIMLPKMVGFAFPSLEIIKPDDGANIKNTIINGS